VKRFARLFAPTLACVALLFPLRARAHHDPLSSLTVTVEASAVRLSLVAPTDELALWSPPAPSQSPEQYAAALARKLQDEASRLFELRLDYNVVSPSNVRAKAENPQTVSLEIEFPAPDGGTLQSLQVFSNLVTKLSKNHQQVVCVQDARGVPSPGGAPRIVAWLTLTPDRFTAFADLSSTAATRPAEVPDFTASAGSASQAEPVSFFRLGLEHILIGYDHLLFLAALLLACATFREAATVITSFTVAHSVTLALAALDVVRLPSRAVEAVIAASIVYVAMENILGMGQSKHRLAWRAAVTFAFGLVHGLGFASVLRELGLGSAPGGVVLPLLKFNLGVETGQLFVAAIVFPIILAVRGRGPVMERSFVPACSVLIAVVGTWWLVQRIAGT
jgi:hydrogenase/urease accessory protein HupE